MHNKSDLGNFVLFCLLFASVSCSGEPFSNMEYDPKISDPTPSQQITDPEPNDRITLPNSRLPAHDIRVINDLGTINPVIIVSSGSEDSDYLPNAILIRTCESEPDEVAVTFNTPNYRFCHIIQATAYHSGEEGASEVSATFEWSVADPSMVHLDLPWNDQDDGPVTSAAFYDIFSSPDNLEPHTQVTVCATPRTGWPVDHTTPLCRTIPLSVIANTDGDWIFTGYGFSPDGDKVQIVQDGRYLVVGDTGVGTVYGTHVHYYLDGYEFSATLMDRTHMEGSINIAGHPDVIGEFQAVRLPDDPM